MKKNGIRIVRETQVNIPESLLTVRRGTSASVVCTEFASLPAVRCAASRLNQRAGYTEFSISTNDNGATIIIRRNNLSS